MNQNKFEKCERAYENYIFGDYHDSYYNTNYCENCGYEINYKNEGICIDCEKNHNNIYNFFI